MRIGVIYCAKNQVNGKVYIGQTVEFFKRRRNHKAAMNKPERYQCKFHRALKKYGWNSFRWKILSVGLSEDMHDREIRFIKNYDSISNGYNITSGGLGGVGCIPWNKGKRMSAEFRKHCSFVRKGCIPWNIGKTMSSESRQHLSEINKKKAPIDAIRRMRESGYSTRAIEKELRIGRMVIRRVIKDHCVFKGGC